MSEDLIEHLQAAGLHPVIIDENTVFPDPPPEPKPEEAQSPFLPGTNIQFAWDSTMLSDIKKCPRYYKYLHIDGWQPKDESVHLRFGQEYHQALHDYERCRADNLDHEESVFHTTRALLERLADYPNPAPDDKPSVRVKTKVNLVRSVIWYLDQFKADPAETVHLTGGSGEDIPAMEVSFKFELDWGPMAVRDTGIPAFLGTDEENEGKTIGMRQPYLLCGHLDRIVTFNDETFVMDRKTATQTLSDHYFAQYSPHNQMTLYAIAGQVVLGTSIRGVIIDAAAVQVGGSWFQRGFTYRTQGQLDEWLKDLHYWLRQAEGYATDNYWPMNDTACDKFGGCRFRDICSKDPAVRDRFLAAQFTKRPEGERWNPLKPR